MSPRPPSYSSRDINITLHYWIIKMFETNEDEKNKIYEDFVRKSVLVILKSRILPELNEDPRVTVNDKVRNK